jgi:ribosomal protein L11 methyltransferase
VPREAAEELRAWFVELAPDGFEEAEAADGVELAAYAEAAERVRVAFPDAKVVEVEAGWEDRWREFHHPVRVGPLWIGPPWERVPTDALAVEIDPGRAFGTGAHPTTRLCLELLLDSPRGSVLDVGCGSGVLAIAAARLGLGPVTAVDIDEIAVDATRANAAANGVSIDVRVLDALAEPLPAADLVVANLTLDGVEALAPLVEAEFVVASGYLARNVPTLPGWASVERRTLEGWAADRFAR